jgi:hypothetical protein
MAEFLSDAWLSELDAAAKDSPELRDSTHGIALTVQQVVRDAPEGEVCYHFELRDGTARVMPGPASAPDVTLFADYETARALHAGETNAQEALARGGLKVRGRLETLAAQGEVLASLEDVFAAVRSRTTYSSRRESTRGN